MYKVKVVDAVALCKSLAIISNGIAVRVVVAVPYTRRFCGVNLIQEGRSEPFAYNRLRTMLSPSAS